MSSHEPPPQEQASAYFVQDRSNLTEMERLALQDELLTSSMGGVLPEQEHPERLRRVLDVGCGTGGWLIETAKAYPQIELLIGVDISATMLDFARAKAQEAGVADRVEFQVGDALRMLEFPPGFFDLVNQRFNSSYVRTWEWGKLLLEERRVVQPEGIIRITEPSAVWKMPNSPAMTRWDHFLLQTLAQAGYWFEPETDSVIDHDCMRCHRFARWDPQTVPEHDEGDLASKKLREGEVRIESSMQACCRKKEGRKRTWEISRVKWLSSLEEVRALARRRPSFWPPMPPPM